MLALLSISPVRAGSPADGGTKAADFLRFGSGARAPALGDAMTAAADRSLALHYNPAGLAGGNDAEISVSYQSQVLNINRGELAFSYPLNEDSAWGIDFAGIDYGSITRTTLANSGAFVIGSTAGQFSAREWNLGLGYGRCIESWSWGLVGRAISSTLDNASAHAASLDAGVQWRPRSLPVEVGGSIRNIGTDLTYDREAGPLPLLSRAGAAVALFDGKLRVFTDIEKVRGEDITFMAGGEVTLFDIVKARAGYDGRNRLGNGLSAGLGVQAKGLAVDYAWQPAGFFGSSHRVGLIYRFGVRPAGGKKKNSLPRPLETRPLPPPDTAVDIGPREWNVKGTWEAKGD